MVSVLLISDILPVFLLIENMVHDCSLSFGVFHIGLNIESKIE